MSSDLHFSAKGKCRSLQGHMEKNGFLCAPFTLQYTLTTSGSWIYIVHPETEEFKTSLWLQKELWAVIRFVQWALRSNEKVIRVAT